MTGTQERDELHRAIWKIAEDLRGSVDGWEFKAYVLGMLFYRFISENLTDHLNREEEKAGAKDFDYTKLSDEEAETGREVTVKEKGFYILPSQLFCNVLKNAADNDDLNETLAKVFASIEGSATGTDGEDALNGLFGDFNVDSTNLGKTVTKRNEKLLSIMKNVGNIKLSSRYEGQSIDTFGDAYEFLMGMYASKAGKSGGEYFTPQEVSRLLAKLALNGKKEVEKVYDPCCGSGSLLLQFAKLIGPENVRKGFFGQESNNTTYNLCRINMILHNISYELFNIKDGDTLLEPHHLDDEPFEAIVSNPPYSHKWVGDANPILINDHRYAPAGVLAPKGYSDFAFIMHILSGLATDGTAAIIEFPGAMYRSGAEQKIRQYLVDNNYVDAVIQLPENLFFGTPISTCILVLKKSKKDDNVLFIDASELFYHEGNKNKLSDDNIEAILKAHKERAEVPHFCALADRAKIEKNSYNLTVSSYVEQKRTEVAVDIVQLNAEIAGIVKRSDGLRREIDAIVAELEGGK